MAQTHHLARRHPEEALGRVLGEVLALDPQLAAQLEAAHAPFGVMRMAGRLADDPLGRVHVLDHQADGIGDDVQAVDLGVEHLAYRLLQHRHLDQLAGLGDAGSFAEQPDGGRRKTASAQAGDGRHPRIVPARHDALVHQRLQLALAGDGVGQVHPGELDLPRQRLVQHPRLRHAGQQPVVQRPVVLELQRAQRMRDPLQRILQRMCVVVHRVDGPGVAGAMVVRLADPVQDRVTHVDVGRGHVDPRTQHHRTIGVLSRTHFPEQAQVLFHRAVTERRVAARLGQRAPVLADLVAGLAVHVGVAGLDQLQRDLVEGLEVVAGVVEVALAIGKGPVEAQPAHRIDDRVDVLLVFLLGVGVVEAQVAAPAVIGRQLEVQADRLGVPDVQEAVGLGRKARADARRIRLACTLDVSRAGLACPGAARQFLAGQVGIDGLADEVADRGGVGLGRAAAGGAGVGRAAGRRPGSIGCLH